MLLLSDGLVFDGSSSEPQRGSVLIEGDRIVDIQPLIHSRSCPTIDCSGLAISPGFIDLHSHSDLQVIEKRPEKLKQGVTTEVVGNCGFSPFPTAGDASALREFAGGILGREGHWGWPTAKDYLQTLIGAAGSDWACALVGHGSLRVAVAGLEQRPLSAAEMDRMCGLLEDALDSGCVGFSTGLMYAPGSSAEPDELERLCAVAARKGKLYATHMRSYSARLVEAVREQIQLAERTGCRLQISHLQAAGRNYWRLQEPALDEIEAAHHRGIDIEFDIYPYQCGSTVLTQFLPQWTLDGGIHALLKRIRQGDTRTEIARELRTSGTKNWADVTISSVATSQNAQLVGMHVNEIAEKRGQDPSECVLDLLLEEGRAINVISFNQNEDNLRQLITHPLCSVITDGFYVTGKPHPRLHGTYPELLGSLVRDRKWLGLSEAIHKSTAKPAARIGIKERGALRKGNFADITIFDPNRVESRSTYDAPEANPIGISKVLKNGRVVFDERII